MTPLHHASSHHAYAMHLQMDTNAMGEEEHALYVTRRDDKPTDRAQRTTLRAAINELYLKHDAEGFSVSVLPLRGERATEMIVTPADARDFNPLPSIDSTTSTHPLASRTTKSAKSAKFSVAGDGGSLNGSVELPVNLEAEAQPVSLGAANV